MSEEKRIEKLEKDQGRFLHYEENGKPYTMPSGAVINDLTEHEKRIKKIEMWIWGDDVPDE